MKLRNMLVIGIAAVALAVGTLGTQAQERQREITMPQNATQVTNLITGATTYLPGGWTNAPQNQATTYVLLTLWEAPGALAGTSNVTVYMDQSPDTVLIVSNRLSFSASLPGAGVTNTTLFGIGGTNLTGLAKWRIGGATTTSLTNAYYTLTPCWFQ